MTLKCYREELYAGIYLNGLRPSITSQIQGSLLFGDRVPSLTTIFSDPVHVMASTSSSPLSFAPSDTTPPSDMAILAPRARDDGLPPRSDGSRPPRGYGRNSYTPCLYCDKKNHFSNKCWKHFGKPPTAQAVVTLLATLSPAFPDTPTLHYHATLTLA